MDFKIPSLDEMEKIHENMDTTSVKSVVSVRIRVHVCMNYIENRIYCVLAKHER